MARQVVSVVRCFAKRKHNQRDELKTSTGSRLARASAASFRMSMDDANVGDDEPESGDEDILISLPTSCRAWRVYHREKRAHDYTKRRLVATFQRETKLLKLVASIDGRVEVVERTAMEMADLEAAMMRFEMKLDTQVQELVMQNDLILKLEASKAQCQFYKERLYETNATLLKYRSKTHEAHLKLLSSELEKERITEELKLVTKAAVLAINRQFVHVDARNHANVSKKKVSDFFSFL